MDAETHIQPVILAGGAGMRLWPASRRDRPKQLLALTGELTLLQETALRLNGFSAVRVASRPVVVTNREYRLSVAEQLGRVGIASARIVAEPQGRSTAPALTLACLALAGENHDPLLLAMPSDHFVADKAAFHEAIAQGAALAEEGMLVLFGVVPTRADTGYGYICVGDALAGAKRARALEEFVEKPGVDTARQYMESGRHLWNSGIFMMRRSVWLQTIELLRPGILSVCRHSFDGARVRDDLVLLDEEVFLGCPAESIDSAVFEQLAARAQQHAQAQTHEQVVAGAQADVQAAVVPLECGWSDVGGWANLADISTTDEFGNTVRGDAMILDTHGTLVQAESSSRLVAAYGVDDLVIVDTPDALLVADKERTRDLGPLVDQVRRLDERLIDRYPRQDRPWGRFESIAAGPGFQVKRLVVEPGAKLSLQFHRHRNEHWVVIRGLAEITCGGSHLRLGKDESTFIPLGTPHRLANPGSEPLEIIEVQSGEYLGEDDVVRLEDDYGRTEAT